MHNAVVVKQGLGGGATEVIIYKGICEEAIAEGIDFDGGVGGTGLLIDES